MDDITITDEQLTSHLPFREIATDAIRYWETRRPLYNGVLALIVLGYLGAALPSSRAAITFDSLLGLFVLAVLANLCYCAAYVVDIFAQLSGFQAVWRRWRGMLLLLGVAFAGVVTRFFAMGFFMLH
jgi:hypothetical protein